MRPHFDPGVYVLATLTFFIDLIDVLIRLYLRHEHTLSGPAGLPAPTSIPLEIGNFTPYEARSEEHTSELQSRSEFVCRLLLEQKTRARRCASVCSSSR